MSYFLKYINELTVNGKPVDEDEDDTDYTKDGEEDENEEQPELDLDPNSTPEPEDTGDTEPTDTDTDDTTGEETPDSDTDSETGSDNAVEEPTGDDVAGEEPETNAEDQPELDLDPASIDTGEEPAPVDNTDDNEAEPSDTTNTDTDDAGGGGDIDTAVDTGEQPEDDTDYTAMSDDPEGESEPTGDDTGEDTGDGDTTEEEPTGNDNQLEEKIKQSEAEIFNTLSDDEKAIRNRQLIDNFVDLKKITKVFLEKVQTITVTDINNEILTFVETSLLNLNNMISDYIITRYNKKAYIENFIIYQQFILTIEQLKDIVSKINIDEKPENKGNRN